MNMRIKKNSAKTFKPDVKASARPLVKQPIESKSYVSAKDHILAAIQALGAEASKGDVFAKESISNLSVVLLDLKAKK